MLWRAMGGKDETSEGMPGWAGSPQRPRPVEMGPAEICQGTTYTTRRNALSSGTTSGAQAELRIQAGIWAAPSGRLSQ